MSKRVLSSSSSSSPTSYYSDSSPVPKPCSVKKKIKVCQKINPPATKEEMEAILEELKKLQQGQEKLNKGQNELKQALHGIENVRKKLDVIDSRLAQLDRISREKNLIIYGLVEEDNEDFMKTTELVEKFFRDTYGVLQDIVDVADRLGRSSKNQNPRPIRVKFRRLYDKRMVMKEKKETR